MWALCDWILCKRFYVRGFLCEGALVFGCLDCLAFSALGGCAFRLGLGEISLIDSK